MSQTELKKVPTQWLDMRDAKTVDYECTAQVVEAQSNLVTCLEDLDVIMGMPSRQTSSAKPSSVKGGFTHAVRNDSSSSLIIGTADTEWICGKSCVPAALSYTHIGDSRLIGVSGLIFLRLLCLGSLGIMAGVSFSLRRTAPLDCLLIELSVWLHVLFLLLYPFLMFSCIMTMQYPDEDDIFEENRYGTWSRWNSLATACHVVKALSITELIRLFILNAIPLIQPFHGRKEAESLFSLQSVFAVQKYLLAAVAIIEILFPTTPQQILNVAIVVLISTCWETILYVTRNSGQTVGQRIMIMLASIALSAVVSVAMILLQTLFSRNSSKLSSTTVGVAAPRH